MKEHKIKCSRQFFERIEDGSKTFEIRYNDRNYKVGDKLTLQEWDPIDGASGRTLERFVSYITDYEQKFGFIVMGLAYSWGPA